MIRFVRVALAILGITVTLAVVIWWVRYHRLPTLRISYTVGRGFAVDLDWIDVRPAPPAV